MALRVEDLNVGPSVALGPVQGRVRIRQQVAAVRARVRICRHAAREGEGAAVSRLGANGAGQDAAHHGVRRLRIGMWQEQCELVTADAEAAVCGPRRTDQQPPHRGQQLVAAGMPVRVVYALQVIEVDDGERQPIADPSGLLELAVELFLECPMVPQPGNRIEQGVGTSLGVQATELGGEGLERGCRPNDASPDERHSGGQDDRQDRESPGQVEADGIVAQHQLGGDHRHDEDEEGPHSPQDAIAKGTEGSILARRGIGSNRPIGHRGGLPPRADPGRCARAHRDRMRETYEVADPAISNRRSHRRMGRSGHPAEPLAGCTVRPTQRSNNVWPESGRRSSRSCVPCWRQRRPFRLPAATARPISRCCPTAVPARTAERARPSSPSPSPSRTPAIARPPRSPSRSTASAPMRWAALVSRTRAAWPIPSR